MTSQPTTFKIEIAADFPMTKAQLEAKLLAWLELNTHTSSSFGFTLVQVQ